MEKPLEFFVRSVGSVLRNTLNTEHHNLLHPLFRKRRNQMKKFLVFLCAVSLTLAVVGVAGATVLTFDDLTPTTSFLTIPDGYGGFDWDQMGYVNGPSHLGSGYDLGRVSGDYVAVNLGAAVATASNGPFGFNGAYLTGAWRNGLNITVQGFLSSVLQDEMTVVVDYDGPTWFDFNFFGIDEVRFTSFGGSEVPGLSGSGAHFAMDNFTFNEGAEPVPEPATLLLLGSGLLGLAGFRRRFRKG